MNRPSQQEQGKSRKAFTTETQLKDAYQVERLLNRLSEHDPAKDTLQEVSLSPAAKEQASASRIARAERQAAAPQPRPNRPREDFIAYQRELAACRLMRQEPPPAPQGIPKITGGFRPEEEEVWPPAREIAPGEPRAEVAPKPPRPAAPTEDIEDIFGESGAGFDPY